LDCDELDHDVHRLRRDRDDSCNCLLAVYYVSGQQSMYMGVIGAEEIHVYLFVPD